jgi:energy-converting hydrogenase Eha subunit F
MATRGFTRLFCCCLSALALLSFIMPSTLAEERFYEFVVRLRPTLAPACCFFS